MIWLAVLPALLLLYTWAGYPVLVRVIGGARRRTMSTGAPSGASVSVIVATRDEPDVVRGRVENLLAGAVATTRFEVIVAIDARAEATELDLDPERVRCVAGDPPGGKAAALNAAVRVASGEILVFADTRQLFEPSTIQRLVDALNDSTLGAVSGRLVLSDAGEGSGLIGRYWRIERWLREWEARWDSAIGVTGAVWAMRRSAWKPLPEAVILDDLHTPMRLVLEGWRVGFEPSAVATDTRPVSTDQEYRRKVRTLTGVFQVCALLPDVLGPWRNRVWLQFVSHKLLRLATPLLLALVLVGFAGTMSSLSANPLRDVLIAAAAVLVLAALALATGTWPRVLRALRVAWGMNAAIVAAARNAMLGRWDVWVK